MYRPKKAPIAEPFILRCQGDLPTDTDIQVILEEARRSNVRPVQMQWPSSTPEAMMTLIVVCPAQGGEPVWVLSERLDRDSIREIWTYPTGDVTLLLNLVISECTGAAAPDTGPDPAGASRIGPNTSSSYSPSLFGLQASSGSRHKALDGGAAKITKVATMEGDLADMQVPNLLQSLAMGKMTGRLFVDNEQAAADLFFVDGVLVHATAMDVRGEQAIVELVTWETGKFYFYREEKTTEHTVEKRLDFILMESVTLLDQSKALLKAGLKMESYLDKKDANLSEAAFDQLMQKGAPADLALQKSFYVQIDGSCSLFELLRKRPMIKSVWVPILFNLISGGLLLVSAKSSKVDKTSMLESTAIDRVAIERVLKSLIRPETGILSYSSFHFFLEQEFLRYQRHQVAFSVIVFDMWFWQNNRFEPLPTEALKAATEAIEVVKRRLDIFSHFEALSFIMLLPHTETASAAILAYRIMELLRSKNLGPVEPQNLALAFGIAGVPEDCEDMGLLLSAAKASKLAAQKNTSPVLMFKDMQSR